MIHLYQGKCPDAVNGPDSRDENCPACKAMTRQPEEPAGRKPFARAISNKETHEVELWIGSYMHSRALEGMHERELFEQHAVDINAAFEERCRGLVEALEDVRLNALGTKRDCQEIARKALEEFRA